MELQHSRSAGTKKTWSGRPDLAGTCPWEGHNIYAETSSPEVQELDFTAGPAASPSRRRDEKLLVIPRSVTLLLPRMAFSPGTPFQKLLIFKGIPKRLAPYFYWVKYNWGLFINCRFSERVSFRPRIKYGVNSSRNPVFSRVSGCLRIRYGAGSSSPA